MEHASPERPQLHVLLIARLLRPLASVLHGFPDHAQRGGAVQHSAVKRALARLQDVKRKRNVLRIPRVRLRLHLKKNLCHSRNRFNPHPQPLSLRERVLRLQSEQVREKCQYQAEALK